MAYIVLPNGTVTRKPGVYGFATYLPQGALQAPVKTLAIVGEFPWLEPATPYLVSGGAAMLALAPNDPTCQLLAQVTWNASNDAQVGSPGPVWVVNMQPSTAALRTFYANSGAYAELTFTSLMYGPAGAGTYVKIEAASGGVGKKYTLSRLGQDAETYDNVQAANVVTIRYNGSTADQMTVAVNYTGIVCHYTINAAALGTWTPGTDLPFAGQLEIGPSAAPVGGNSCRAVVTGIDNRGAPATDTLDWPDGGGAAPQTTAHHYAAVTSIVFSAVGYAPTFSIDGDAVNLTAAEVPTLASIVNRLSSLPSWVVLLNDPRGNRIPTAEVDDASGSIRAATVIVHANVWAAVNAMSQSQLCTVAIASDATVLMQPDNAAGFLYGGTAGTTQRSDVQAAFAALETEDVQPIVVDLLSSDWSDELSAHVNRCWAQVASERVGFTAAAAGASLATLNAATKTLNNADVGYGFESVTVPAPTSGTVTLDPVWGALIAASMQTGIAGPGSLLNKRPNIAEFSCNPAIKPDRDYETLLQMGLLFAYHSGTGIVWMDDYSSYRTDVDDPFRSHLAPQMSLALCFRALRESIRSQIGETASIAQKGLIRSIALTVMAALKSNGTIRDYNGIDVIESGDTLQVIGEVNPMETLRFVKLALSVTRIAVTA